VLNSKNFKPVFANLFVMATHKFTACSWLHDPPPPTQKNVINNYDIISLIIIFTKINFIIEC